VRVPPSRGRGIAREQRMSDGVAHLYLAAAAILHAARLGVEHDLPLPPPQRPGEAPNTDVRIPENLDAALDLLAADKELVEAMGPELVEAFTILKRAEWERYLASGAVASTTDVTEWELGYYLP